MHGRYRFKSIIILSGSVMDPFRKFLVKPNKSAANQIKLKDWDPQYSGNKSKIEMLTEMEQYSKKISELQYKLFAANSKSLLIILQGADASGKDGTIRQVMGALNPQNCYVKSFKAPSETELAHDYLWRIHSEVPSKGQIAIFNRSHYEDIIEPSVNNLVSNDQLNLRYSQINDFERYLSENNVTIIKFFLHISKDEQRRRLQERIQDPTKQWKIKESDLVSHRNWGKYMDAYEKVVSLCNRKWAPWYIIPANVKHFRNWAISYIILKKLESMKPEFPRVKIDSSEFTI
jgi:PPK2 family polyphosphate:nucleotide phosphotransferase